VSTILGIRPFSDSLFISPYIVCVFPEDVCPYAKIAPLNPSNMPKTKNL